MEIMNFPWEFTFQGAGFTLTNKTMESDWDIYDTNLVFVGYSGIDDMKFNR